jgi:hypothetical protein
MASKEIIAMPEAADVARSSPAYSGNCRERAAASAGTPVPNIAPLELRDTRYRIKSMKQYARVFLPRF